MTSERGQYGRQGSQYMKKGIRCPERRERRKIKLEKDLFISATENQVGVRGHMDSWRTQLAGDVL